MENLIKQIKEEMDYLHTLTGLADQDLLDIEDETINAINSTSRKIQYLYTELKKLKGEK